MRIRTMRGRNAKRTNTCRQSTTMDSRSMNETRNAHTRQRRPHHRGRWKIAEFVENVDECGMPCATGCTPSQDANKEQQPSKRLPAVVSSTRSKAPQPSPYTTHAPTRKSIVMIRFSTTARRPSTYTRPEAQRLPKQNAVVLPRRHLVVRPNGAKSNAQLVSDVATPRVESLFRGQRRKKNQGLAQTFSGCDLANTFRYKAM